MKGSFTALPDPADSPPDSGALRRSALLGQRKKNSSSPEKPVALRRKEKEAPPTVELPPAAAKPRKRSTRKSKEEELTDPLDELRAALEELRRQLDARPGWDDLLALENKLRQVAASTESNNELVLLRSRLNARQEELEELSQIVQELQEQQSAAQSRMEELERNGEEDRLARRQLEKLLHTARQKLRSSEKERAEQQARLERAEGFLREALLGLLSPGDEFNEELVEQIQEFLTRQ